MHCACLQDISTFRSHKVCLRYKYIIFLQLTKLIVINQLSCLWLIYAARPMCGWLGNTQISESVFSFPTKLMQQYTEKDVIAGAISLAVNCPIYNPRASTIVQFTLFWSILKSFQRIEFLCPMVDL